MQVVVGLGASIALMALLVACASIEYVRGPGVAETVALAEVVIEPIHADDGKRVVLRDARSLQTAQRLLASDGWEKNEDLALVAHHRMILRAKDGTEWSYYLGTFSDPPRPPCFSFCTGYWAAAAEPDGRIRWDVYRSLAASRDLFAVSELLDTTSD